MKLSPANIHHSVTPSTCNGQNCKNYPQSLGNICVDKSLLSLFVLNMNFLKDLQLFMPQGELYQLRNRNPLQKIAK